MSQSMTFAPAWAKAVAIPSPMPDAAPVTNAVFPASSFTRILPPCKRTPSPQDAKCPRTPYDRVFERLGSVPDVRSWHIASVSAVQRHVWSWGKTGSNRTTVKTALMTHSRTRGRVACSLGRLTSAASRRSVCDRRQGELKAGAAGHVCAGPQASVMRFDNRPADRQPKPQTARFRGVESLEHAVKIRRCEAWTCISHLD